MNKKLLASAVISVFSFGALADTPSYDYLDGGYSSFSFDEIPTLTGFEVKGSKSISDSFYIAGDYSLVSKNGFDVSFTTVGIGFNTDITSNSSFFAEVDYANLNPDGGGSADGFEATAGIRSMLTEKLELKAAVEYLDLSNDGDSDNLTSFVFGAAYEINDSFAVYADYKLESDLDRFGVGVRFKF